MILGVLIAAFLLQWAMTINVNIVYVNQNKRVQRWLYLAALVVNLLAVWTIACVV